MKDAAHIGRDLVPTYRQLDQLVGVRWHHAQIDRLERLPEGQVGAFSYWRRTYDRTTAVRTMQQFSNLDIERLSEELNSSRLAEQSENLADAEFLVLNLIARLDHAFSPSRGGSLSFTKSLACSLLIARWASRWLFKKRQYW